MSDLSTLIEDVKAPDLKIGDLITGYRPDVNSIYSITDPDPERWKIVKSKAGWWHSPAGSLFPHDHTYLFRVERPAYKEMDAVATDIQMGDTVIGWQISRSHAWITKWEEAPMSFPINGVAPDGVLTSGSTRVANPKDKLTWFRIRRPLAQNTRVVSKWNGKCFCGANTLTLFSSVEHEGKCRQ